MTATRYKLRHTHLHRVYIVRIEHRTPRMTRRCVVVTQSEPRWFQVCFPRGRVNATVIIFFKRVSTRRIDVVVNRGVANFHRLDLRTKEFFRVGRREGKKAWVIVAGSGETLARRTRANRATAPSPTHAPSPPTHPPSLPVSGATQIINFYQSSGRTKTERSRFCVSTHGSPSVSRPRPVVENYIARASISRRCAECPSECCAFRAFQFF